MERGIRETVKESEVKAGDSSAGHLKGPARSPALGFHLLLSIRHPHVYSQTAAVQINMTGGLHCCQQLKPDLGRYFV